MMRLTKVELRRLFSRRLTSIAMLGALALTALICSPPFSRPNRSAAKRLAYQQAGLEQAQKDWKVSGEQQVEDCLRDAGRDAEDGPERQRLLRRVVNPRWRTWAVKPWRTSDKLMLETHASAGPSLLAFIGFVVGAGFVAAEFSSGSMANG